MIATAQRLLATVFAAICRLYPRRFRDRFGLDMRHSFAERCRSAADEGGVTRLLRRGGGDSAAALAGAVRERTGASSARRAGSASRTSSLIDDLRAAWRSLRRAPGFCVAAILTLALGIGANSAIFSVIHTVLLRPLPFTQPERLVAMRTTLQAGSWWSASLADVVEWRELNRSMDGIAFARPEDLALAGDAYPEQISGARVSANFFDVLGTNTAHGRTFGADEARPDAPKTVVLTWGAWQRRFGGDDQIVGRTIVLDSEATTVLGVLPADFRADFLFGPEIFVPRPLREDDIWARGRLWATIGRLTDGAAVEAAQEDMDRVAALVEERNPDTMAGWGVNLLPLHSQLVGSLPALLWTLLGAVGFVLLVACANVANLTLARGTGRGQEFAVRQALGAGRSRIFAQVLLEGALLGLAGGSLGLLLAVYGLDGIRGFAPSTLPRVEETGLDPTVLGFTTAVSLFASVLFAWIPARRAGAAAPAASLNESSARAGASRRAWSYRKLLVASQIALVLVLLIGASLMLQSFALLRAVDPGFDPADKLVVELTLPDSKYAESGEIVAFFDRLREGLAGVPGVTSVGAVTNVPFVSFTGYTAYHLIEGRPAPPPGEEPVGGVEMVSPNYFESMGMTILSGRGLTELDRAETRPVAVINDEMAELYWPDSDPLGERIRLGPPSAGDAIAQPREIVGIVSGVQYGMNLAIRPRLYVPDAQTPAPIPSRGLILDVRGRAPEGVIPDVRRVLAELDPEQPLARAQPFAEIAAASLERDRLQALLVGLFGLIGLALGVVGVYGVVSCTVGERTREVGIRMALGADAGSVIGLVLRTTLVPVVIGIVTGIALTLGVGRLITGLLFEVDASDPTTIAAVAVLLTAVALLASFVPARRATGIDPVQALREE